MPPQEVPLPEVGGQEASEEGVCLRELDNVWRERLHEPQQLTDTSPNSSN